MQQVNIPKVPDVKPDSMIRIVIISDTHGKHDTLTNVPDVSTVWMGLPLGSPLMWRSVNAGRHPAPLWGFLYGRRPG